MLNDDSLWVGIFLGLISGVYLVALFNDDN